MDIGTSIQLQIKKDGKIQKDVYRCKVIDENRKHLIVDLPVDVYTGKTAFLFGQQEISVSYNENNQAVYAFTTKIVKRIKGTVPALVLDRPKKEDIKRIQRREYARVDVSVDVAVHSVDGKFPPFHSVTQDISGGGLAIVLPKNVLIESGDKLAVWLVLPMKEGDTHYVDAQAEVVKPVLTELQIQTVALKFTFLSTKQRQKIIQFTFERQLELRKKETT